MAWGVLTVVTTGASPGSVTTAGRLADAAQPRPTKATTKATSTPRNTTWPRSCQSPPIRLSTNRALLSSADRMQKGQQSWMPNTITPTSTPLNTAMPVLNRKRPHQLVWPKDVLVSPVSTRGSTAINSTAP